MKRCVILTAGPLGSLTKDDLELTDEDFIICSDGGYAHAQALGIVPHMAVGDFDSYRGQLPQDLEIVRASCEKDDTDTLMAIRIGLERGYRSFVLAAAAAGGRLDHTFANLQTLSFLESHGAQGVIVDGDERVHLVQNGSLTLPGRKDRYVSVFSVSPRSEGVTLEGLYYPLRDAVLTYDFPIGVSNEAVAPAFTVSVREGTLLVMECRK